MATKKQPTAGTWNVGDAVIDSITRNYLEIVELDGDEAVLEHTQEDLRGTRLRLPLSRLAAVPE